jgi:hypothetical protein
MVLAGIEGEIEIGLAAVGAHPVAVDGELRVDLEADDGGAHDVDARLVGGRVGRRVLVLFCLGVVVDGCRAARLGDKGIHVGLVIRSDRDARTIANTGFVLRECIDGHRVSAIKTRSRCFI